jgi:hypothetical protein
MLPFIDMMRFGQAMIVMTANVRGLRPIVIRLRMLVRPLARSGRTETAPRLGLLTTNVHPSREVAQQQRRQGQASDRRTDGFQHSVPDSKTEPPRDPVDRKSFKRDDRWPDQG